MAEKKAEVCDACAAGHGLSESMTGKIGEMDYKILRWYRKVKGGMDCMFYVYKDEDDIVTPGTAVKKSESSGFQLDTTFFQLEPIPSVDELARRPIDLESSHFGWFRELRNGVQPVDKSQRPWVLVVLGFPGSCKSNFLNEGPPPRSQEV